MAWGSLEGSDSQGGGRGYKDGKNKRNKRKATYEGGKYWHAMQTHASSKTSENQKGKFIIRLTGWPTINGLKIQVKKKSIKTSS